MRRMMGEGRDKVGRRERKGREKGDNEKDDGRRER